MAKALQIARTDADEPFVPRIRRLVESERVREARALVKEALRVHPWEPGLQQWSEVLAPARNLNAPRRQDRDFDRSAEIQWLEEHVEEYRGQWVALLGNTLLAHGETLDEVVAELESVDPGRRALLHRIH